MPNKETAVFNMPLLSEQAILQRRARGRVAALLVTLLQALVCYAVKDAAFWSDESMLFAGFLFLVGVVQLPFLFNCLLWHQVDYQWLPQRECGVLADVCEQEPGLRVYRDAVCAMGRRFTDLEARNMHRWASEQAAARADAARESAESACKRLYGTLAQ